MSLESWLSYVATVLLLMSTPGPSHLLMLSTSMTNGFRRSLATAAGDLTANALQMMLAGLGLATLLNQTRYGFVVLKWAGVGYLIWMGVRQIQRSFANGVGYEAATPLPARRLWLRGFVTSAANPKAVVFFAALFPQFIESGRALPPQLAILGATYIAIDGAFLIAYGIGADWLAQRLGGSARQWLERTAGGFLVAAAVLLGLKAVDRTQ